MGDGMNTRSKLRIDISRLTIPDFKLAESLSAGEKSELLTLLNTSYPHFGYNHIFDNYPCYKHLYVFRLRLNNTLVASRQLLIVDELYKSPAWAIEMNDVLQTQRFAIGSRAIVHPFLRGQGLGSKLVQMVNQEAYSNHGVEAIFGSSTNMGAISLYLQRGAKLWKDDIQKLNPDQTSLANNIHLEILFKKINNPQARMSSPLRYVYRNETANYNEKWNPSLYTLDTHQTAETYMAV